MSRKIDYRRMLESVSSVLIGGLLLLLFVFIFFRVDTSNFYIGRYVSDYAKSDDYVHSVALICNLYENSYDKYSCVLDYFNTVFRYNHTIGVREPKRMLFEGGDCLDASVFFCSVMKNFDGFDCRVDSLNNIEHAIAIVTFDDTYCVLDQKMSQCREVIGVE